MATHRRHGAADSEPVERSRTWLAHHAPEHGERCLHVRGVAVCRRCAVLYPVAVLTAVAVLVTDPPSAWLVAAMWLLPIPMVIDWVAEQLGTVRYAPTRQVAVTAIGAPALGVAVAIHAVEPFSLAAVAPVAVWTTVCASVAVHSWWHALPEESPGWQEHHEQDEARRSERLEAMLSDADTRRGRDPVD